MNKQTQITRHNPLAEDARRAPVGHRLHHCAGAFLAVLWLFFGAARVLAQTNALGTTNLVEGPAAGADSVVLAVTPSTQSWTATANDSWLHLDAANGSGTGSANVIFSYDANTNGTRIGTLTVAGLTLTVTQAGSAYVAANPFTTLIASGFFRQWGVAVDGAGNVYIADSGNNSMDKWSAADGTVPLPVSGLYDPQGVAVDGAGNVYISDSGNNAIKEWTAATGIVTTLVSSGLSSPRGLAVDSEGNVYFADNGSKSIKKWAAASGTVTSLVSSGLSNPLGVAVDRAGNVYFSDPANGAIYQWSASTGTVTTLLSPVSVPRGVAVDGAGNVYFAAKGNHSINKWTAATGAVTTLVSSGLNNPTGVAVDAAGDVYIADAGNAIETKVIEELPRAFVDPTTKLEPAAAGSDALPAVLPATENLAGQFAPASDSVWLTITGATNGVVSFAFTANPSLSRTAHITLLGTTTPITQGAFPAWLGTNALTEGAAEGSDSVDVTVSSAAGPWVATANASWLHLDAANQSGTGSATVVFTFDSAGMPRTGTLTIAGQTLTVTQAAGNGLGTSTLVEGPAAGADSVVLAVFAPVPAWTATANDAWLHLSAANGSGTGSANVVFTFDANPGATRIGTLTVAGTTLTVTQAGSTYVAAPAFATLVSSGLNLPFGLAVDRAGNVYIADAHNNAIKEWTAANASVITLVPSGPNGLNDPSGAAVDGAGNVYIADYNNNAIKKWTAASGAVTTLVAAGLNGPSGVAVDSAGNVYIADSGNNAIEKWTAATQTLTTLVSSGLNRPWGVAVDAAGNVYIADNYNYAIKVWTAASGTVTTLVSSGVSTSYGVAVDGAGNVYFADWGNNAIKAWTAASGTVKTLVSGLNGPADVAVDGAGNVYIADAYNNAIEELPRAFVDPTARLEPAASGSDVLPVVLPATENLSGPFSPASDQSWLTVTGVTNGVVSYAFTTNTTLATRTAHIALLGQSITITQAGAAAPTLTNPVWLPSGSFQFGFTGTAGASYSVLFSTNAGLPLSAWTVVGPATSTAPGQFHFTITPSATVPKGFYRVGSP